MNNISLPHNVHRGVTSSNPNYTNTIASLQTANATPVVLHTDIIRTGDFWFAEILVHGNQTDGSDFFHRRIAAVVKPSGSDVEIVYTASSAGASGWDVSYEVGANIGGDLYNMELIVTGESSTNIDWYLVECRVAKYR